MPMHLADSTTVKKQSHSEPERHNASEEKNVSCTDTKECRWSMVNLEYAKRCYTQTRKDYRWRVQPEVGQRDGRDKRIFALWRLLRINMVLPERNWKIEAYNQNRKNNCEPQFGH